MANSATGRQLDTSNKATFVHGVASGDPETESVLLWTTASVDAGSIGWEMATDCDFDDIIASGHLDLVADPNRDVAPGMSRRPVHVRVTGLAPGTVYRYRFVENGVTSPVGCTSTLPDASAEPERFRLGVASCARVGTSSFGPYDALATTQPDLVVHLGDYIYEDGGDQHEPPHSCTDSVDYVQRYAQYHRRPELHRLHRVAPWVTVWDDHEVADDAWRTGSSSTGEADTSEWERRRSDAQRVYFDWMPEQPSTSGPTPMDRRIRIAGLADIVIVDSRHAARARPVSRSGPALVQPDDARRLLSDEQWDWLESCVDECPGWLILCTQTQVSETRLARLPNPRRRLRTDPFVNPGQWDGYPVERRRLASLLAGTAGRTLLLSGDLHGRFHTGLPTENEQWIPEVTTPSIASTPFADAVTAKLPGPVPARWLRRWLSWLNPHISHMDLEGHGSTTIDITPDALTITSLDASGPGRRWQIARGDASLQPFTALDIDD